MAHNYYSGMQQPTVNYDSINNKHTENNSIGDVIPLQVICHLNSAWKEVCTWSSLSVTEGL